MIKRKTETCDVLVIGTGASGWNAAVSLRKQGVMHVTVATDGVMRGTSRNTGSDKQTYYKLSLGGEEDSILEMADTLFAGGAMDGEVALAEAAASAREFLHLADLGVPFPQDRFGRFPGYKTDHDPRGRASSCGPYTSREMTERLEKEAAAYGCAVEEGLILAELVKDSKGRVIGAAFLDAGEADTTIRVIYASAVILAVGASAGLYGESVYPESQVGGMGAALRAGAEAVNLTEWQYGIASTEPRWNLSGSYQQVLPRYYSVDADGREYDFLRETFSCESELLNTIFLKGYQWPFDAEKAEAGSSRVDLAVWNETRRGRKVYMDFRCNPLGKTWEELRALLGPEAADYLVRSGVTEETPIERLRHMNEPAYTLYLDKGVDLAREPLPIGVCAQHQNGGIKVDAWWRTTLPGLYAVGECAGTHGVRRPGGAALNSGQVGSLRAAQHIAAGTLCEAKPDEETACELASLETEIEALKGLEGKPPADLLEALHERMRSMMVLRSFKDAQNAAAFADETFAALTQKVTAPTTGTLKEALYLRDLLTAAAAMGHMTEDYIAGGGESRGSALVWDETGTMIPVEGIRCRAAGRSLEDRRWIICRKKGKWTCRTEKVMPVPRDELWFEQAWKIYRDGGIYG